MAFCSPREWIRLAAVAPSRERGSKLVRAERRRSAVGRSLTGAWIETPLVWPISRPRTVAPSRERGSKLGEELLRHRLEQVAPSRERGSKRDALHDKVPPIPVAPSRERG